MFEGIQITVEVPFGYSKRDQILEFMAAKFPGAAISIVHSEVTSPTVSEAFVQHDATLNPGETDATAAGGDSEAILISASDALSEFTKSNG